MRQVILLALSSLLMMSPATARDVQHLADGFKEAVFSVRDLDAAVEVYRSVAGWQIVHRGDAGADQARAMAPNLGHLTPRFPVSDLGTYLKQIQARGVEPVSGPAELKMAPYGTVRAFAVRATEGAWLEFMELPED